MPTSPGYNNDELAWEDEDWLGDVTLTNALQLDGEEQADNSMTNSPIVFPQTFTAGQLVGKNGSDGGVEWTSPICKSKKNSRDKQRKHTKRTCAAKKSAKKDQHEADARAHREILQSTLDGLTADGIYFAELLAFALERANISKTWLIENLFENSKHVTNILDALASSRNSKKGRAIVRGWARDLIAEEIYSEGQAVTRSAILRVDQRQINASLVRNFSSGALFGEIRERCPSTLAMLSSMATTRRQKKELSMFRRERKTFVSIMYEFVHDYTTYVLFTQSSSPYH